MISQATFALPPLWPALPEILLAVAALALVTLGAIRGERANRLIQAGCVAAMLVAIVLVLQQGSGRVESFGGSFVSDAFTRFMKVLVLLGSIAGILLSLAYLRDERIERFEYPILILLSTIGMMMMVSAGDLIALYLGLELLSLSLYVVASIHRDDARSSEAGLKYFVLGALSSGMLLYGASLVYGFTGNVNFAAIAEAVKGPQGTGVVFGLVFVTAGLAFKVSAVPFHMWTPDVYEGSPTPVTAFFAGAPKVAAMALFVRVLAEGFPTITSQWQQIITFVAIASMVLGGFAAIGQSNLKRLMAYSSIGNMGYALVGLAAGTASGVQGVAMFMALYMAMTLGVFACILALRTEGGRVETIEDLAGLSRTHPFIALVLALQMFALVGIPPLGGFFAKWHVFLAAVEAKLWLLAVIGVVASVVSAFYYLRIVKVMYTDEPRPTKLMATPELKGVIGVTFAFIAFFVVVWGPMAALTDRAAKSFPQVTRTVAAAR
jgi:NADH-quinone oxidoreductase subunit N